ncbi:TetR/AcrR family transcriptional regulator [Actinomadura atramentaria]|uniref:TetR/AcrR family transcriptional regulator n=1 Tax=Actinomadura atramentaria TaxID=1990 RepID=UPI0003702372|nr:TetR/AcrR family transcriptional regulator [Actinomadura atramentaria]
MANGGTGAGSGTGRERPSFRRLSSDRRREEIIAAGIRTFGNRPEPEVSIDDVAAAAGTSRSSVYRYFDGKGELYEVVAQRVGSDLNDRLEAVPGTSPSELVMARLAVYFDFLEEYEGGYAGILGIGAARAPLAALAVAQGVRDRICALTYRTLEVDEPSEPLRVAVRSWIAGVEWAGAEWLRTRSPSRGELEMLLGTQMLTQLVGTAATDPLTADRVAWLLRVEPLDSPFGLALRGMADVFDRRALGALARFLAHTDT